MTLPYHEIERRAAQLEMSPTWHLLAGMADGIPLDVTKLEDLKTALTSCSLDLIFALDAGRIQFDRDEEKALFIGLLTVAVQTVLDGKLGARGGSAPRCH